MKVLSFFKALIPVYGRPERFRVYLRLREFFRKKKMFFLGKCLKHHFLSKYGCELGVTAEISPKTQFMHTTGVVIGDGCLVEEGVKIYSSVVLGRKNIQSEDDYPKILKNAILCTGATLLGKITVGENAMIGAQSLVLCDVEPNSLYVGSPARKIKELDSQIE